MQEIIDHIGDALRSLAKATNGILRLPRSEKRAMAYGLSCNAARLLGSLLGMFVVKKEETCEKS